MGVRHGARLPLVRLRSEEGRARCGGDRSSRRLELLLLLLQQGKLLLELALLQLELLEGVLVCCCGLLCAVERDMSDRAGKV